MKRGGLLLSHDVDAFALALDDAQLGAIIREVLDLRREKPPFSDDRIMMALYMRYLADSTANEAAYIKNGLGQSIRKAYEAYKDGGNEDDGEFIRLYRESGKLEEYGLEAISDIELLELIHEKRRKK